MKHFPPHIVAATVAVVVHVLLFVGTGWYIRSSSHPDLGAVSWSYQIYYDYASRALDGQVPYRDFLVEYPVLSFPLFFLPRLIVSDFPSYRIAFAAEMLLFDIAAILLIVRHVLVRRDNKKVVEALAWYTAFCVATAVLVVGRFELAPMVLAFAAAHWWFSGRDVLGGFTAGLGTLMKVFPALIVPIAMLSEVTRLKATRARGTAMFAATLAVGLLIWFAIGGVNVLDSFRYHAARGLGIETVYAGAVLAWGSFTGVNIPWVIDHKAVHLAPEWGDSLAAFTTPLQVAALALVLVQFWRSGMADGIRYATAAVLASLVTSKVLSPQYLIWLFPFVAVLEGWTGSRARWLLLFCCLITALIYPGPAFAQIMDQQGAAILCLNLRNLLLLSVVGLLLYGPCAEVTGAGGETRKEPVVSCSR
jgi:hypothetical protein